MKLAGSEILIRSLLAEGVSTLFGYPGGQVIPVFDTLYDYRHELHHVLTRHEQGAVHAAQGYARASGGVGVCLVTSGPGATNVITGVGDAMLDSTPVVVIAGQVASPMLGTDAFQEIDVVGITQPITKWAYQIRRAEDVAWAVARAFYIARSGRPGPVVLDFTKDAQVQQAEFAYRPCTFIRSYQPVPEADPARLDEAARLIDAAERPLALVGQGVILARAEEELKAFLEKADIPAASTLLGLSALPSDYPLNKGFLGMHGNVAPNMKTNEADVLIAIGMRFDDRLTGNVAKYAPQAKIIHLDIDPSEIGKNIPVDVPVLGNAKVTLQALTARVSPCKHTAWIRSFDEYDRLEHDKVIRRELYPDGHALTMGEVVRRVSEATGHDAVLVTDVGQNQMMAARYFRHSRTRSLVTSGGLGTMGFGIPAAMGAKLAVPARTVCLFCGDGGFQMTMQELGTIMQEHLGVKIILLDNHYLGMVRQWQELFYHERYSFTAMNNPDFTAIARAYGITSRTVERRADLDDAIDDMLRDDDEPYLLVARVEDKGMVYPMVPAGAGITEILLGEEDKR